MILPIGHEEDSTRRMPVVTFVLMGICVAAFFLSGRSAPGGRHEDRIVEDAREALEFYASHPYLELDSEFRALVFPDERAEEELPLLDDAYDGGAFRAPSPSQIASRQERLDLLVDRAMKGYAEHPLRVWGLTPNRVSPVSLLAHMFLHAGWLHLLGNLLILYLAGPFVEDVWGRPLFAGFYVAAGLFAALLFVALNRDSTVPLIGASGAIAGVMGAFFVRYGSTRIRFLYVFGLLIRGTFEAPAWIMLPMWFAMQLFMAALTSGSQPEGGVAYWAHVGGFAFGAGVALAMKEWRIEERFLHPAIESRTNLTVLSNPVVDEALEARRTGDLDRAFRMLSAEARSNPANRDGAIALWSLATDLGRPADAVPALLGTIEHSLRSGDDLGALESWEELAELVPEPTADAGLLVRLAEGYLRNSCPDNALVTLRRALLAGGGGMDGALALRIARLARDLDPTVARGALDLTLRREDLDPDVRMRAQQILADLN